MGEIYFNLFLAVVSVAGFINTFSWQVITDSSGGPAIYPRLILTGLFICAIVRIFQILKQKKEERRAFVFLDLFYGHRGFFLLTLVIYAASVTWLGFLIATVIYLNVVVNVMIYFSKGSFKADKWLVLRIICLTVAAYAITWFFQSALRVMVPTGIFGI
ncbi:MAG: tripartite tricarboxylate transporter TctB family protein [Clostridiales bacterium]|nr:tripartite tricarboxylate transporter TctB family protein [Clostridiales bacterium]